MAWVEFWIGESVQGGGRYDGAMAPASNPSRVIDAELKRLERLARLMDSGIRLPVIGYRIGWDGLIGLIPGAGDVITAGVSLFILIRAKRLGVGRSTLMRMAGNIAVDLVAGAIPVVGDLFDFAFKANIRNLRLLRRALGRPGDV